MSGPESNALQKTIGALLVSMASVLGACQSSGSAEATATMGPASGSLSIEWGNQQKHTEVIIVELTGGMRIDVTFYDSTGATLGSATGAGAGDRVTVPDGAASIVISGPSTASTCTGCAGGSGGGGSGGGTGGFCVQPPLSPAFEPEPPTARLTQPFICGIPVRYFSRNAVDYGPLANTAWWIDILDGTDDGPDELFDRIRPVVLGDPMNLPALPPSMKIESLSKFVPGELTRDGQLFTYNVSSRPFESFSFWLNGNQFATLNANSIQHDQPFGWRVIEVPLGLSDLQFSTDGSSDNHLLIEQQRVEAAEPGRIAWSFSS